METDLKDIRRTLQPLSMVVLGTKFDIRLERDNQSALSGGGRIFIQILFSAPCQKTGEFKERRGRKWYLSDYMTEDEVIKTAFAALKAVVEHEVMEGFKFNKVPVFNPHVSYTALLRVSGEEIQRS